MNNTMTEQELHILGIVMDDATIRKFAREHIDNSDGPAELRKEIFKRLADDIVVHSELGLDYEWKNSKALLKDALDDSRIEYVENGDLLTVSLSNLQPDIKANDDGSVGLLLEDGKIKVNFSGRSIVKLLRFIDVALPAGESKVGAKCLEIKRDDLAQSIAEVVLHYFFQK